MSDPVENDESIWMWGKGFERFIGAKFEAFNFKYYPPNRCYPAKTKEDVFNKNLLQNMHQKIAENKEFFKLKNDYKRPQQIEIDILAVAEEDQLEKFLKTPGLEFNHYQKVNGVQKARKLIVGELTIRTSKFEDKLLQTHKDAWSIGHAPTDDMETVFMIIFNDEKPKPQDYALLEKRILDCPLHKTNDIYVVFYRTYSRHYFDYVFGELDASEKKVVKLDQDNTQLKVQIGDMKTEITNLTISKDHEVAGLNDEIAGLNDEIASLNNKIADLNDKTFTLKTENETLNERVTTLSNDVAELKAMISHKFEAIEKSK